MRFLKSITWFEWLVIGAALLLGFIALAPAEALGADITDFGAISGGPDTTPAWNAAVTAASNSTDRTIRIPAGNFYFYSAPLPLPTGTRVVGESKSLSVLMRNYSGGDFIVMVGQGSALRDVSLYAVAGTSGGIGLHAVSNNTTAGGNHTIEDVWITGSGTWALPLFLDGDQRTNPPIGIRCVSLRNVHIFNATWYAAELWNCVSCEWFGGGIYQGYGTNQTLVIGGPLGQKNRVDADIDWATAYVWPGQMRQPTN